MQTQAARHTLKFQSLGSGECPVSLVSAFLLPIPSPPLVLDSQSAVLRAGLSALLVLCDPHFRLPLAWSYSTLTALYIEQRGCDFPQRQTLHLEGESASGQVLLLLTLQSSDLHLDRSQPDGLSVPRCSGQNTEGFLGVSTLCWVKAGAAECHKSWRNTVIQDFIGLVCLSASFLFLSSTASQTSPHTVDCSPLA